MQLLKFGQANNKLKELEKVLDKALFTFSLPAGHSCPGAQACMARADRKTGKITDGNNQEFRCFAASMEWRSNIREARWHNFDLLKGKTREGMRDLILGSLPKAAEVIRVHVSGDFFNEAYFLAWMDVARATPSVEFYAYTKSVNWWIAHRAEVPSNFSLTASMGGRFDGLVEEFMLKNSRVTKTVDEAVKLGLKIDHDDYLAYDRNARSFALLIHGSQQAGSEAGQAVRALGGVGSYSARTRIRPAALDYVSGIQTAEQGQNAA
jgi:hypothetical protein